MPLPRTESATRARPDGLRPAEPTGGGPSAVMVVQEKQSAWQKQWHNMQSKVICSQVYNSAFVQASWLVGAGFWATYNGRR